MGKFVRQVCLLTCITALTGCASSGFSLGVKPWQKGTLSKDSMQIKHSQLQAEFDSHIYFAREASSGGGMGGGGCGCN
jgi:hypothetical protein|tara:strand:+ start:1153 stop:1386 length:234 start_codon:yes stop_codon:yes gene_type:complete